MTFPTRRWLLPLLLALAALLVGCGRAPAPGAQPEVVSALATSKTSIRVTFSRAVGQGADVAANYTVAGPEGERLEVIAAYPADDGLSVMLATAAQEPVTYLLSATGIMAADGGGSVRLETSASFGGSGENAPIVASAIALATNQILVTFADPNSGQAAAMSESAADIRYYELSDPDLKILSASQVAGDTAVILETARQKAQDYTLKVTNVTSKSGDKLIDPFNSTVSFRGIAPEDAEGPTVKSVAVLGLTELLVTFSEPVRETANDASHYLIHQSDDESQTLAVTKAELNEFGTQAVLTTDAQAKGVDYTLEVSGLLDLKGNLMDPDPSSATFVGGRKLGPVESDTSPPRVANVGSTGNTKVKVTFSEPVLEGAEDPENYQITADNLGGDLGTQSVLIVTAAELSGAGTTVTLTTMPQSDIEYTLSVVDVRDLSGNQIAPPERGVPTPSSLRFVGTAGDGAPADTDGDGLSDAEEQRGWIINVKLLDGTVVQREVTSSPYDADTDGDGISDFDEKNYGADPRNEDTDDDGLTDYQELNEVYSSPDDQDSDDDGLADGLEYEFFKTSPLLADTDGDQFSDGDEVGLDNRNPRLADLPIVEVEVGNVDLRLDVRFEEQTSQGTTTIDSRSVATTLTQSQEQSLAKENASTLEWFVQGSAELCLYGGCEEAKPGGAKFSVEGGASGSSTSTFTTESSQATQKEYATSLSTDKEVSAESVVTRVVEGATMGVAVNLRNASNIAFSISDIEITALVQDPRDPTQFVPVASLFSASGGPISIGPLTPVRGPFRFEAQEAFPQLVESLMKNPRGLIFRVANFEIEDEFGRKFAFVEQDINDRTAFLEIDYAGNLDLERYRAATNAGFDANGKTIGLSMHQVMQEVLGLAFVPEDEDIGLTPDTAENADLIDNSYSTRTVGGVERLYRVRGVSPSLLNDANRKWWVITPNGYNPLLSFDKIRVFSDQDFAFKFVQDADDDLLEAAQEALYRSNDRDKDTDGDGIDDADEVFGYLAANGRRTGWTIQLEDGQDALRTFSNPSRADTDGDGLTDCQELYPLLSAADKAACSAITVYKDANGVPTLKAKGTGGQNNTLVTNALYLTKATDPANPDSDGDGLTDLQEVIGFAYTDLSGQPKTVVATSIKTATNPLSRDTDVDGLADFQEVMLGTDPTVSDGDTVLDDDGDGLVNLRETTGWSVTVKGASSTSTYTAKPDPKKIDTDGDGLTDWEEYTGCRDRNRDLACDTEERFGRTDPTKADTDGDGLTDRQEVDSVDFRGDPEEPYRFTDPLDYDMDGDGLSDGTEATTSWTVNVVGQGGRVVWSDPLDADRDRDGLNDASEKALGSDPNNADSDGDGALDGLENVRITNILEPDYLVTVFYRGLQAGKGTASANSDCDDGSNPGDFYFYFQVGRPTASGALSFETVVTNASVAVRDCENGGDGGPCRNTDNGYIRLASPQKLRMNEPSTFAVPFTDLFTIEGQVQEIDPGGADLTYDFGGIGTPDGSYRGSQLELGAFDVAFNDPPLAVGNRACLVEVTVQVKVE